MRGEGVALGDHSHSASRVKIYEWTTSIPGNPTNYFFHLNMRKQRLICLRMTRNWVAVGWCATVAGHDA